MRQGQFVRLRPFRTSAQKLHEQIMRVRRGKRGIKKSYVGRNVVCDRRRRGRTRRPVGRGVVHRLIGDEPIYPPTDYITKRAFDLRMLK